MTTDQTIFKEKKGISFEVLWKKYLRRDLGKWKHGSFQYLIGFNLAILDIILVGGALNRYHLSLCCLNFCVRIRWSSPEYRMTAMPKPRKKVTLRTAKKRRKPMRSGGRPALDRGELLKKAKALGVFFPPDISTLRIDSLVTMAEADKIFNEKMKRRK